jgi:hypothetical protein
MPPPQPRVRLELRIVQPGEQRAFGRLTAVECVGGLVRLHVAVDGRDLVTASARFSDLDLRLYVETRERSLACGARTPADPVYVTWRTQKPGGWPGDVAGVAVALEFLPPDVVP